MSVIRAIDVPDTSRSEAPIEVIAVEAIDGHDEFLSEDSIVAAGHEKGESEGVEDALALFPSEGPGELEWLVEADGSQPSSMVNQTDSHGEETQPPPGVPGRYLTAARAAALLVVFCAIAGGVVVTRRLTTPPVAQQTEVTGRSVSPPGPADSPVPAESRLRFVDPNAASEVAAGATQLPAKIDPPATSRPGGANVSADRARDRTRRSESSEVDESVIGQSALELVPLRSPVSPPATVREQVEPMPGSLATRMAAADGIADVPQPAAPPDRPRTEPLSPSVEPQRDVGDGIEGVLSRYLSALNQLDPAAVRGVWPTANVNALGRAFAQLESQQVGFDDCTIVMSGAQARAECRGMLSYIPRIGKKNLRVEPRQWRFDLHKVDADWLIAAVAAQ